MLIRRCRDSLRLGKEPFQMFCIEELQKVINHILYPTDSVVKDDKAYTIQSIYRFEARHIAVIAKTQEADDINLKYIMDTINQKQDLKTVDTINQKESWKLCTIKEYQKSAIDKIPICYSKDVSSLEWPIVIHIRYTNTAGTYSSVGEEDNVIPSRCMVHYILICREDIPDDVVPKSFKGFNNLAELFKSNINFKKSDFL